MTFDTAHRRQQAAVLSIILVSYVMIILDASIVFTGLPRIRADLAFPSTQLAWVQSIYTLTFGGFLLFGARAGDLLGRRRTYQAGLAIFTVASVMVAMSHGPLFMIAARGLQGLGAAILAPSSLALLSIHFPEGPERRRATSLYGAVAGIGSSVGLVLGGLLADLASWRVGFIINLPISIVLSIAATRCIGESERHAGAFDVLGAVLSTLGFGLLIWGIVEGGELGWGQPQAWGGMLAGCLGVLAFVLHEARAPQPIMPLRLFAHRERLGAYLCRFLFLGAMVSFFFFSTQFMQLVLGFSSLQAGLGFLPMTLVNFFVAYYAPRLSRHIGDHLQVALGLLLALGGLYGLSLAQPGSSYLAAIALPMAVLGMGQGLCFGPMTASGIAGTCKQDAGAASGVLNVAHQLGMSIGLGLMAALAVTAEAGRSDPASIARGVGVAMHGAAALALGALLVALVLLVPAGRATATKSA